MSLTSILQRVCRRGRRSMRPVPVVALATLLGVSACTSGTRGSRGLPPAFSEERAKEVVCTVESLPNYITHMSALAGLPYRTAYADAWGYTVDPEGHAILQRHAPLLQWGYGHTGDLAPFFVLLPAYLPLEDEFALFEYLRAVDLAMRDGDYGTVKELYPRAYRRLGRWIFNFEGFFHSRAEAYHTYLRGVRQLAQVYEHNFQRWEEEAWRDQELDLDLLAGELNGDLWALDLLHSWERRTGESFAGRRYEVVLSAAPAGTGITGLGYDRSLLSADVPREQMLGLIVHEVGAHLLVDLYQGLMAQGPIDGEFDWAASAAYAGLVTHYTRQILPTYHTEIENDVEIFAGIYQQIADREPGASARRLLQLGLAEHRAGQR